MGRPDLDAWEKRFSSDRYAFGTEPNAYHQRSAHLIPAGARVLVVADEVTGIQEHARHASAGRVPAAALAEREAR